MAELTGNIHEKIGDLRIERGLTKKQVSEDLGIPASQLTRIENENIKSIGHDLIIKFADYFGVSTDYLLGKTDIRFRKNVELSKLGLSNKALVVLLSGMVDMQLLSQIIENKYFVSLMNYAESYFKGEHEKGFLSRNEMIDMAVTDIAEYIEQHPSAVRAGQKDIRQLRAQKVSGTEADLEKLKFIFMMIMKDVKKQYGEKEDDISEEEICEQIKEMHRKALVEKQSQKLDVGAMVDITAQMIAPLGLNEENMQAFKNLVENVLRASGDGNIKNDI